MTTGFARLGQRGKRQGTIAEQVHDGDTITSAPDGNIGVRLLGIDTPEISFQFPTNDGKVRFVSIKDARWGELLGNPFDEAKYGAFGQQIPAGLKAWWQSRTGKHEAATHHQHADAATQGLRRMVEADRQVMGKSVEEFDFYMIFGHEVMDGYGRFLCLINRNQPKRTEPTPRPPTYNQRMLERGLAFPYFIWPNINPYDLGDSIMDSVIKPGTAAEAAAANREMTTARTNVQNARRQHLGVFSATDPAMLEPFELRAIARRTLPGRYLIDLSKNENVLIHPLNYHTVPHPEDRLFVPKHYVPLFESVGWQTQTEPA